MLAWRGGDFALAALGPVKLTGFEAIMAFDGFAIAFSGVALVTYMSTLTSLGYTATQYALLTSALAWTGKILKGFSGVMVEALEKGHTLVEAYGLFYVLSAAVGLPAIVLQFPVRGTGRLRRRPQFRGRGAVRGLAAQTGAALQALGSD